MYNSDFKVTQLFLEQGDNTFNFINEVILLLNKHSSFYLSSCIIKCLI